MRLTLAALASLGVGAAILVVRRQRRELFLPPHLHEIDRTCDQILADPAHARRDTALGVGASLHVLREFNHQNDVAVAYRAFYNRLAGPGFAAHSAAPASMVRAQAASALGGSARGHDRLGATRLWTTKTADGCS